MIFLVINRSNFVYILVDFAILPRSPQIFMKHRARFPIGWTPLADTKDNRTNVQSVCPLSPRWRLTLIETNLYYRRQLLNFSHQKHCFNSLQVLYCIAIFSHSRGITAFAIPVTALLPRILSQFPIIAIIPAVAAILPRYVLPCLTL